MLATETHFHRLANSLAQLVWVVDAAGHLSYGNSAWQAFTAIGAGARFVDHYLPVLHPDDRGTWRDTWEEAVRCGEPYALERRVRSTPESNYVNQLEWGHPIRENGVGTGAWLITATDCDESERLIAELRRRMESKERFLALLAHEMRGPLAPIANALRVVQENAGEPAIVRRCCATLARQVAQLVRFADDLFDLARSQSARFLLTDAPVGLDTVIEAAVEASQPEIAAREQRLTVEVPTGVTLAGDVGRLTQVFANLLINAAKFTDRGGHIDILAEVESGGPTGQPGGSTSQPGGPMGQPDWVLVKVRDSGCGIPREMLGRIFDAHVQGSAPFGTAGAGLGLALVRHLVELHGGAVSASSSGLGRGSEFLVRLPALSRSHHHAPWRLLEPLESVPQRIEERPREPDV